MNEIPKYQRVTLDTPTYERLGEVAKRNGFTRAGYVRFMVTQSDKGLPVAPIDPVVTTRKEGPVRLSELSSFERFGTEKMESRGIVINVGLRRKLQRVRELFLLLDELLPDWETDTNME